LGLGGVFLSVNIDKVPLSGRRRFILVSEDIEQKMGEAAYRRMLIANKHRLLPPESRHVRSLKRVGTVLVESAGLQRFNWEFNVVDDPNTANALVLPGGKVIVFTGILPIMHDEDGMATILGHEIGHILARHTAERITYFSILSLIHLFLLLVLGINISDLFFLGFGLPWSRSCEREADFIGLILMARSCYDPNKAPDVWKRMSQREKSVNLPLLSTHPSHESRLKNLQKWKDEAFKERENAGCGPIRDEYSLPRRSSQTPGRFETEVVRSRRPTYD